ncbi:uncharacterized protein [Panulirus ornatus]|uniref:uncharacterized protein n=1 Tax=Panulirus ornatus TaxID=150431 RepID=UPI003A8BEDC3
MDHEGRLQVLVAALAAASTVSSSSLDGLWQPGRLASVYQSRGEGDPSVPSGLYSTPVTPPPVPSGLYDTPSETRPASSGVFQTPFDPSSDPFQVLSEPSDVFETPSAPSDVFETPSAPSDVFETPSAPSDVVETPSAPSDVVETPSAPSDVVETPSDLDETPMESDPRLQEAAQKLRPDVAQPMEGMPYDFQFGVEDQDSGNAYSHVENSDGRTTQGEYRVLLPDGRTQVVKFFDSGEGFTASVTYEQ